MATRHFIAEPRTFPTWSRVPSAPLDGLIASLQPRVPHIQGRALLPIGHGAERAR